MGTVAMWAAISACDRGVVQSGARDTQLGIIKAGNVYLRGGKPAKNRAVVAVTRKPAVLLHRIWTAQESYVPFYAEVA
jgi:hypothetical protein